MQKVLIIGYGRMGRIRGKHLDELNVSWDFHDPAIGGVDLCPEHYSHIIISTPIPTHFEVYQSLRDFQGKILIEKPVVTENSQLWVLNDPRVFPGLTERYNPVTEKLLESVRFSDLTSIQFHRTSLFPCLEDISIHDFDLLSIFLGEIENYEVLKNTASVDRFDLSIRVNSIEVDFTWEKSTLKKRCATFFGSERIVADFHNQTINEKSLNFEYPVPKELQKFLTEKWSNDLAFQSHSLMIDCLKCFPASNN